MNSLLEMGVCSGAGVSLVVCFSHQWESVCQRTGLQKAVMCISDEDLGLWEVVVFHGKFYLKKNTQNFQDILSPGLHLSTAL